MSHVSKLMEINVWGKENLNQLDFALNFTNYSLEVKHFQQKFHRLGPHRNRRFEKQKCGQIDRKSAYVLEKSIK